MIGSVNQAAIGDYADLDTTAKTSAVDAINEVVASVITLDDRIDTIIASSGTSDTEVVDARGTYTVLRDRLSDLVWATDVLLVDANYTGDQATEGRYTDISTAMSACSGGEIVMVAPGIYTENVTIPADNIHLIGAGRPVLDDGTGRLVGGTVIRGKIQCGAYVGLEIRDLGVDGADGSSDCIASSGIAVPTNAWRTFKNLTLLGAGTAALDHGLYGAGDHLTIDNVHCINVHHGIAIHGSYVNISNCQFDRCGGSTVIIKSKGPGDVMHVNVSNIVMRGDPDSVSQADWSGPLAIQSSVDPFVTKFVNITNVVATDCVNGVVQIQRSGVGGGVIEDISFTNVTSSRNHDAAIVGDYWIRSGDRITFTQCRSIDRINGNGFVVDPADNAGDVYLYNCIGDGSGSGDYTGTFAAVELNHGTAVEATGRTQWSFGQGLTATKNNVASAGAGAAFYLDGSGGVVSGAVLVSVEATGGTTTSSGLWVLTWGWSVSNCTMLGRSLYGHSDLTLAASMDTTPRTLTLTVVQTNASAALNAIRVSVFPIGAFYDQSNLVLTLAAA